MDLVVDCYRVSEQFPDEEKYGLTSQVQRTAGLIPADIAKGKQRYHLRELLHHISIALKSLAEIETQFILAQRLEFMTDEALRAVLDKTTEIGKMLNGLGNSLKANQSV